VRRCRLRKSAVRRSQATNAGSWSGKQPIQLSYRWRRCDAKGGDCVSATVTSQTYAVGSDDVSHTLRVLVTASNSAGSAAAISNATSLVSSSGPPAGTCQPIAKVSLPQLLVVDQITYSPFRIQSRSQPLVARFHVVSTKGFCVSGALVLVLGLGVPFDRLSQEPEVTTGATGWAQISFHVLPTFQLRHGNLVVIFVRARKPGDSILAGVSTRPLVSVRVA
jgi:hypothetical protein